MSLVFQKSTDRYGSEFIRGFMNRFQYFLSIVLLIGSLRLSPEASILGKNSDVAFASADPIIAAAGDIACDPAHREFNGG
jgi:hypothetical protein